MTKLLYAFVWSSLSAVALGAAGLIAGIPL